MNRILDPRARRDRTRSRAWFLQVHYRWESEGHGFTPGEALAATVRARRIAPSRLPYLERLVSAFEENREVIESTISQCLDNWRLERLSVMDRGILRLGATEILCLPDLPGKVSIQESVRLAERYGGSESPRFVNGVLDAVFRAAGSADSPGRG